MIASEPNAHAADRVGGRRPQGDSVGEPRAFGLPAEPPLAELLIDCEEDRTLRAVLGMLREADRSGLS